MGIARLLAKAWIAVCLYAGADALKLTLEGGLDATGGALAVAVSVLLFAAMGLMFVAGFGLSVEHGGLRRMVRIDPSHLIPGFDEIAFVLFAVLSFVNQAWFAPAHLSGSIVEGLEQAIRFVVPGQRALEAAVHPCMIDGGRLFASSFSWFLALIYLCSAASRIGLTAALMRMERRRHFCVLGERSQAFAVGAVALIGVQLLYVGSLYALLPCGALAGLSGALIVGLAPLMLAYAVIAALASLLACDKG